MKFAIALTKQWIASAILILHYHKEYRLNDFKNGTGTVDGHLVLFWAIREFWFTESSSPLLWNSTESFLHGMME